jgi:putative methionine-R-sulfoxide reductase with GAF domain
VVVNDVTANPRYLTTFASTLSEVIVPVVDPEMGMVVATLDVESAEQDAFAEADRQALEGAPRSGPVYRPGHSDCGGQVGGHSRR